MQEIADDELRHLIAGMLSTFVESPMFPVKVREVERIDNVDGQGVGFTIITDSGLAYPVLVGFEGQR